MGVRNSGFGIRALSLAEVMLAMAIIAFAVLTMMGVYISGLRLMVRGEEMTMATEAGRRFLESVRYRGYDNIPDGTRFFDGRIPDIADADLGFPPTPYPIERRYPMTVLTEKVGATMKSVTVKVYYDDQSHVVLQTYFKR